MAAWWWSWLLTAVGVTGLYVAGRKSRWGWAIGLGAQGLWIAYALVSTQYGFLASSLAYGAVYGRNLHRWSKERSAASAEGPRLLPLDHIPCGYCSWSIDLGDDWNEQVLAWEMHRQHVKTRHPAARLTTTEENTQ